MPLVFFHTDNVDLGRTHRELERADLENLKGNRDVELQPGVRLILRSPDGNRWSITVDNTGAISAIAM